MRFLVFRLFIFPVTQDARQSAPVHSRAISSPEAAPPSENPIRWRRSNQPWRNSALGRTIESLMGFLRKYSGVLPETHLTFGQAIHEVTQPLLRSTENANEVAIFLCTVHLTCQLVRGLLRVCYSVFLSTLEIYCFAYTTYILGISVYLLVYNQIIKEDTTKGIITSKFSLYSICLK